MKYVFLTTCLIALAVGAAYYMYTAGVYRFNYPSIEKYPVQGLDVSHHQNQIRWDLVAQSPYKFAYIKATEGGDFKDTRFQENWEQARKAGLKVGAYHFFTLCRDGTTQAQNMISSVPYEQDTLPLAIDLEYVGNCAARPAKEDFRKDLQDFIKTIETHYRQEPILYTTYEFHEDYLEDTDFVRYPIWLRSIFHEPDDKRIPNWVIWQFADNDVTVPGIDGRVDLNAIPRDNAFIKQHFK